VTRTQSKLLPARPKRLPEELLFCWLVRLSRANALKIQELMTLIAGGARHSLLERDLDSYLNPRYAKSIAALTSVSAEDLERQTFFHQMPQLTSLAPKPKTRRWVLPFVTQSRRLVRPWTQWCTVCLREDATPYLRRHWRLAFVTVCSRHRIRLKDRCPHCGGPFNFHSLDMNARRFDRIVPITICGDCRRSILDDASVEPASSCAEKFQRLLLWSLARGWLRVPQRGWTYSSLIFDVFIRLLGQLPGSKGLHLLFDDCLGRLPLLKAYGEPTVGERFEWWALPLRHDAMAWLGALFDHWPHSFVERCTKLKVTSNAIWGDRGAAPYWFWSVVSEHLYRPWYRMTKEERQRAAQALKTDVPTTTYWLRQRLLKLHSVKISAQPSAEQLSMF